MNRDDLDEDALAEVMRLSGATTEKDAVDLALRQYAERHRRYEALRRHVKAAQNRDYEEWLELGEAEKNLPA